MSLKRRAVRLRRRIVAGSLVGFALLWSVVFAQLVSGHDPVLSRSESSSGVRTAPKPRAVRQRPPSEGFTDDEVESPEPEPESGEDESLSAEQAEVEAAEAERAELEQAQAEQLELERAEAEQLELEAATTGQS